MRLPCTEAMLEARSKRKMPFCFKIIFQECLDQNNFSMAGWISFQLLDNFAPEFTIPLKYAVEV